MAKVPIFEDMQAVIAKLHADGHRLLILSSNTTANVAVFLDTHQLTSCFDAVYTVPYGNIWFKARALRRITHRLRIDRSTSYYVGNEALDVHAAKRVGMRAVAATWSGQDEADLKAAKPDVIIRRPAELTPIFATIE